MVLPLALFLLPLAFGRVAVPGDDLTQNYPVRYLVGLDLRHGHLPLWDPFEWSGTPLLAGFNAGAFYPATLLFAFLPAPLAWDLGQVATYALCGVGIFLFLRRVGLSPLPCWLASLAFTWGGYMAAHEAHMGLVEGASWTGWILLALDHLARPGPRRGASAGWAGFLGLAVGLVCLAGDPRAVSSAAVPAILYAGWLWWREPRARRRLVGWLIAAAVVGGLIATAQLLPGLPAQLASQRGGRSLEAFGAGSLTAARLVLLAFPFLLGGFGSLGLPPFAADYNITEVTGYVGLLTLAGALAAVGWLRRGRRAPAGTGLWALTSLVGVLLALGNRTPLGDLLVHIPLYGGQRLQSRNLAIVDLALVVLFAMWAERFLSARPPGPGRLWLLAPATVGAVAVVAAAWRGGAANWLGAGSPLLPRVWVYALVSLATAAAVVWLVLRGPALPVRRRSLATAVLVVADLGFLYANAAVGWEPAAALTPGPAPPGPAAISPAAASGTPLQGLLPPGTRYAIYDPALRYPGYIQLVAGGPPVPDQNILSGLPSEQGYGSLVWGPYDQATGSHDQGGFLPGLLATPLADQLDLGLVLAAPADAAGDLYPVLKAPRWKLVGTVAGLEAFQNQDPLSQAWVEGPAGHRSQRVPAAAAPGPALDGAATYPVSAAGSGSRLVRSETWAPGWVAVVRDGAGAVVRTEPVVRDGLLQAAALPGPGRWTVSFAYRPGLVYVGVGLAAAGLVGAGALMSYPLVGMVAARRRRRRGAPDLGARPATDKKVGPRP